MRDHSRRSTERELLADPDDQDALHHAIAARQRAGLPVPGWMHARALQPARSFQASLPLDVSALLADGRERGLGRTGAEPLEVPEHRTFWVKPPRPSDAHLEALASELAAEGVPGLALGPDVTDAGLAHLEALADQLTYLDLSACPQVSAAGLAELRPLEVLATLRLWYCPSLDEAGLRAVSGLEGLSTLDLGHCTGFPEGALAHLATLKELSVLKLGSCNQLGDAVISHLRALPHLTSLDLRRCVRLSDEGLAGLAGAPELTVLNLSFCTELSLSGLSALRELPRLTQVYLLGCGLDADKAQAALGNPSCQVWV